MRVLKGAHSRWLYGAVLLVVGYLAGSSVAPPLSAEAEVREVQPPATFKSGGERSEIILKDIAAVLQRMDARLANLEKSASEMVLLQKKR
jgi:hypothetical protein